MYIPSLKRDVKFKPITTKQQQSFYTCLVDNIIYNTRFIITTYNVIKESCTEPDIIDSLTIIDRLVILLALRKNTLGSNIIVHKDDVDWAVSFDSSLEYAKTLQIPESKTCITKNIQVDIHVPLIVDQYGMEKELREKEPVDKNVDYNNAVEQAILNEACKLIKEIYVIEGSDPISLNYNALTYTDRLTLIENLPAEILLELQNYAKTINIITSDLLTIDTDNNDTVTIDIAVDFFLDK